MKVLIVHHEAEYFGGAEKMLGYFLAGGMGKDVQVTVAGVAGTRAMKVIPPAIEQVHVADNHRFSPIQFSRQVLPLWRYLRAHPCDLIHGWAARDWELVSVLTFLSRLPNLGTLHDHPQAFYMPYKRRRLIYFCGRWGLNHIVCVSRAVQAACLAAGYPARKLSVIPNGLPIRSLIQKEEIRLPIRLGYLGGFAEGKGKGFIGLVRILEELSQVTSIPWKIHLGGAVPADAGPNWKEALLQRCGVGSWRTHIQWAGWVDDPVAFLHRMDLLLFTSTMFDSYPTVLLEAAQAGTPVLAARVGGVGEIVTPEVTGWLFEPEQWGAAAHLLARVIAQPALLRQTGVQAQAWAQQEGTVEKMVAQYRQLYSIIGQR